LTCSSKAQRQESSSAMYEGIDTVVLFEKLAYEDVLPLAWTSTQDVPSEIVRRGMNERNLRLLQACMVLQEHAQPEKHDERLPLQADIIRLDMKVDVLLDLVGQLLNANRPRPQSCEVRFNSLGAVWQQKGNLPAAQSAGVLQLYLKEFSVEPLRMTGRVASASEDGRIKVQFDQVEEAVADLLEKIAFRRHRRKVAGVRQARRE
jgi:hypothetical protein